MFSINPYKSNFPITNKSEVPLKAMVSQFSGKSKFILREKILPGVSSITSYIEEEGTFEEWTFLSVEKANVENSSKDLQYRSVEEKFGYIPSFMPQKSFCLLQILLEQKPDLVIVEGSPALAYYALLSSSQGSLLLDTLFMLNEPAAWAYTLEKDCKFPTGRTDIELNTIEKDAFSRFDFVFDDVASQFLSWAYSAGWGDESVHFYRSDDFVAENKNNNVQDGEKSFLKQSSNDPFISVCIATFNRPIFLDQALQSLSCQSYRNFEVIIVDDGSSSKNLRQLKVLQEKYQKFGWHFYFQKNYGPATARNFAASKSKGSHLLFMDDDNYALVNELACFAKAVEHSDADIYTCIPGWHPESELTSGLNIPILTSDEHHSEVSPDWLPIGGYLELGVLINCFGDNNALYRKSAFLKLGGYSGDRSFVMEDMELFIRALVAGCRLEVIPEVLFLYRKHKESRSLAQSIFSSHLQTLFPYRQLIDKKLWPLLHCLRKGFHDRHNDIRTTLNTENNIHAGEWILLNTNKRVTLNNGMYNENGWVPDSYAELSFFIDAPGKNISVLFECFGKGKLDFSLADNNYSVLCDAGSNKALLECNLLPGALEGENEVKIKFTNNDHIKICRFAIMRQVNLS